MSENIFGSELIIKVIRMGKMQYCEKCGYTLNDNANFCPKCGAKVCWDKSDNITSYASPLSNTEHTNKHKKITFGIVLLWIFFFPVMVIVTIAKSATLTKPIKAILIITFVILLIFASVFSNEKGSIPSIDTTSKQTTDTPTTQNDIFSEIITDGALRQNFINACNQIGMDPEQIKDLEHVDDWINGPRYSFTYSGMSFRLYCNTDSTVNTIKLGADTDIYKQGYEPYNVADYIVDTSIASELTTLSESYVSSQLNYPSSADFAWLDWNYSRDHNLYSVSSTVTAQNAFGVEDELAFRLIYQVNDGTAKLLYFELDGNVLLNNLNSVSKPERKKIETPQAEKAENSSNSIVLTDGELGKYGKEVDLDGETYIDYHVPEGKYSVSNNGNWCKVFVAKDKYYKNSEGYMENEIVETLEFINYGETKTLFVCEGEHIELTASASITLTPTE